MVPLAGGVGPEELVISKAINCTAQTASGTINGTVTDASQAVVAGAHITLTEQQTNFTRAASTDSGGFFQFRALPFNVYSVQVDQPGSSKEIIKDIPLQVAEIRTMNVGLKTGAVEQSVTVSASKPLVQVTDTRLFVIRASGSVALSILR